MIVHHLPGVIGFLRLFYVTDTHKRCCFGGWFFGFRALRDKGALVFPRGFLSRTATCQARGIKKQTRLRRPARFFAFLRSGCRPSVSVSGASVIQQTTENSSAPACDFPKAPPFMGAGITDADFPLRPSYWFIIQHSLCSVNSGAFFSWACVLFLFILCSFSVFEEGFRLAVSFFRQNAQKRGSFFVHSVN